ncbi:MAG TPA: hypothetical protein VFV41_10560 [Streptosporangiaceae bacterium]|nr:hypothetical protein [Streptosporangiaceae bacterium]
MSRRRRSTESQIYDALKIYNDARAIRRGRIGRRVARRVYGRASSRLARRLFR